MLDESVIVVLNLKVEFKMWDVWMRNGDFSFNCFWGGDVEEEGLSWLLFMFMFEFLVFEIKLEFLFE